MIGRIENIRLCTVVDINDDTDSELIKVRLTPEDNPISNIEDLPYAFPLLPKMLHVKPKIGEAVFLFLSTLNDGTSQRYYVGPVISQPQNMYKEGALSAQSFMTGSLTKPQVAPSTIPTIDGVLPNNEDICLIGRKNTDIQITDDDIRLKSGVKLVNESNKTDMTFNEKDPAYVKLKYNGDGIIGNNVNEYGNSYYNREEAIKQVNSTASIVADKIFLISNSSDEINFTTTDRKDLITDDELSRAVFEAYKLPYGEKLVEILNVLIKAFLTHTHPFSMLPPVQTEDINYLNDKKAELLDNQKLLSDTVRIN